MSTSQCIRRLNLSDNLIVQGHRIELGQLKLNVYTMMGARDDLEVKTLCHPKYHLLCLFLMSLLLFVFYTSFVISALKCDLRLNLIKQKFDEMTLNKWINLNHRPVNHELNRKFILDCGNSSLMKKSSQLKVTYQLSPELSNTSHVFLRGQILVSRNISD